MHMIRVFFLAHRASSLGGKFGKMSHWGKNLEKYPLEARGLGQSPQLPEARGLVAKTPTLENFVLFSKINLISGLF